MLQVVTNDKYICELNKRLKDRTRPGVYVTIVNNCSCIELIFVRVTSQATYDDISYLTAPTHNHLGLHMSVYLQSMHAQFQFQLHWKLFKTQDLSIIQIRISYKFKFLFQLKTLLWVPYNETCSYSKDFLAKCLR